MIDWLPLALGAVVVGAAIFVLWSVFGGGRKADQQDLYLLALERWIEGDLAEAAQLLTKVIDQNPDAVDPYLQLGNLLRLQGQAGKAAILHRGLTVRDQLPRTKKVAVGLALAEDLISLERWQEAGQVLDTLAREASGRPQYWQIRFAQQFGQGDLPDAARTLKKAARKVPERDRNWFDKAYVSFQLDRALEHLRSGETADARARFRDVEKMPHAQQRVGLVAALLAAAEQDTAGAVELASSGLLADSAELELFLPVLRDLLLESGQFSRTIPILERACQGKESPPSLWISLALLYEKVGQRDQALRLLESKARRPGLTPDVAAPFLRKLATEATDTDFHRVWEFLALPLPVSVWSCNSCGRQEKNLRWFCPACRGFDTYAMGTQSAAGDFT